MLTDKNIYPEPTQFGLPPAGGIFTDPTFGTPIVRVTDEAEDGVQAHHIYAAMWPAINADDSLIFYGRGNPTAPTVAEVNPETLEIANKRHLWSATGGQKFQIQWAKWSSLRPAIMYSTRGNSIYEIDVLGGAVIEVRDFEPENPGGSLMRLTMSDNDDVFAVTTRGPEGYRGFQVWRRSDDMILCNLSAIGIAEPKVCKAALDKSGRYWCGGIQGAYVRALVDCIDRKILRGWPAGEYPYQNWGHGDDGHGIAVAIGHQNTYRKYDLSDPKLVANSVALQPQRPDWRMSVHISLRGPDDECLVSTYAWKRDTHIPGLYYNEVYTLSTDGLNNVRRLAHHHSYPHGYWDSPRAVLSHSGRLAVWTSTWGNRTGRRDVFMASTENEDPSPPDPDPNPEPHQHPELEQPLLNMENEIAQLKAGRRVDQGRLSAIETKLANVKVAL
jgi:hypothetical protein